MMNRFTALPLLAVTMLVLGGCSSSGDDVHISFCKDLIRAHLGISNIEWQSTSAEPNGYQGLPVVLDFTVPSGESHQATCEYEHAQQDDTALTLSDPLAAYATSPEWVSIDGQSLGRVELARAIQKTATLQGHETIERVQTELDQASQDLQRQLQKAGQQ